MTRRLPQPGELLAERYRIVRLIGEGGMGAVLEAENTLTHKRVAIKLVHPQYGLASEAALRLMREAQASCRVRHQNVVDVYDVGYHDDALFLIMELLEGEPLSALLERGGLSAHEFIHIVLAAMRGVAAAHQAGVVHRDIHPGNIFLAREPPSAEVVPKVLDFGISKVRDDRQHVLTGSGVTMGTPHYMSYEQLCSARDIDARTDVYSFGVILYEGLTGQPPFDAGVLTELLIKVATGTPVPPKQLYPELPTALDRLILWAMARDRDERLPTLEAFIDELEPFASERAFRTQMTDPQHTLPAIVQRHGSGRPAPRVEPARDEPAVAAEPPRAEASEPSGGRAASEPPAERAADLGPRAGADVEVRASEAPARGSRPPKPRLSPGLLMAAATLAVLLGGTAVLRLRAPASRAGPKVVAPPPLPSLESGFAVPAPVRPPGQASAVHSGSPSAAALPYVLADAATPIASHDDPAAEVADAGAAESPSASPAPRAPSRPSRETARPSGRRFRAGEARPADFLP